MQKLKFVLILLFNLLIVSTANSQSMTGVVTHCHAGQTNGTINLSINTGSQNLTYYKWVRLNSGSTTIIEQGASINDVNVNNLQDGLYLFYYQNGSNLVDYRYFLVGEVGKTTSVSFKLNNNSDRSKYFEDALITYLKGNQDGSSTGGNQTGITAATNNIYDIKSLIKYNVDFDPALAFSTAEQTLEPKAGHYRKSASDNSGWLSLITSNWDESTVTWNTAPNTMTTNQVSIAPTQANTYTMRFDTLDILKFVEYWQNNTNNGFELALQNYNQQRPASLDYKSSDYGNPTLNLSYTVIPPVQSSFNDETNMGTITVNAPQANLPYTYLINTAPIGTLQDAWNSMGDTTIIDSTAFFQGDTNTLTYQFNNLPSGEYYVGVYDNNGIKIMDGQGLVNTEIKLMEANNLILNSDYSIELDPNSQGLGSGRLLAELQSTEEGGLSFELLTLGEFIIGFNESTASVATIETDFEFGIKFKTNGTYQIIAGNVLQQTGGGNVMVNSKIDLIKEYNDFVLYINGNEVYRYQPTSQNGAALSIDIVHTSPTAKWLSRVYLGSYKISGIYYMPTYPECGQNKGSLNINTATWAKILSCTLINNQPGGANPGGAFEASGNSGVYPNIPIGTYTLTCNYEITTMFGTTIHTTTEQIAIGYVVEWENQVNNSVIPLNTIQPTTTLVFPNAATANSTNTTLSGYLNWVQFETDVLGGPLGVAHSENIKFTNNSAVYAFSMSNSNAGILSMTAAFNNPPFTLGYLTGESPNAVWRIEQDGSNFELFRGGTISVLSGTSSVSGIFDLNIRQVGKPKYIKTIASFCSDYPIIDQYVEPKREIEGGYFLVPSDDTLRFEFKEEYTIPGNLNYTVRNYAGTEEMSLGILSEVFGDNRFLLDVSTLSAGVYMMEIINDKKENWFIRFKVQ